MFSCKKENIGDYIKNRDFSYAVKCSQCSNAVGFEPEDIEYTEHNKDAYEAKVKCPWCGHKIFIGELGVFGTTVQFTRQYFTVIDNRNGKIIDTL